MTAMRTREESLNAQRDEWDKFKGKTVTHISSTTDGADEIWVTLHFSDGTTLLVGSPTYDLWFDGGEGITDVYPEHEVEERIFPDLETN
jgi:hypothetical protein